MTKQIKLASIFGAAALLALPLHADGGKRGKNFADMDADGNGSVSLEEMKAKHAERFAEMDADNSGEVSLEEMQAHHEDKGNKRKGGHGNRMAIMFRGLDADGSGGISAAEMAAMHDLDARFGELDSNGDGALSEDELKAGRGKWGKRKKDG